MLNRPLSDLTENDVLALVANNVAERRDLEFKRDLPGGTDKEIKEFLADVTSLANAQGGDLIIGVEDTAGIASGVPGIDVSDVDGTMLRLESLVRDSVDPRISVKMQWVQLASGRGALVMRFPASLAAPHRVTFKNNGRFWTRNSRGKYEMDVHELRLAFTESEGVPQRLRQLHDDAIGAAAGRDMPYALNPEPVAVLSILPLSLLRDRRDLVLTPGDTIMPVKASSASWLPTLEGMLWHYPPNDKGTIGAYALTHRSGRIDAGFVIGGQRKLRDGQPAILTWPSRFEEGVTEMVTHGIGRLRSYGIEGPWVIMTTVVGIKGAQLPLPNGELSRLAWRDSAKLPELFLETVDVAALQPVFKAFWLLFGEERP